jgi:hypothetical protein
LGTTAQEVTLAKSRAVEHVAALLPAEESLQPTLNARLHEKTA